MAYSENILVYFSIFLSNYRWTKISKMCSSHGLTGIRVSAIDGSNLLSSENGINPKGER